MKLRKLLFTSIGAAALLASTASAHTPYIVPISFDPAFGKMVTLDASFAEKFFLPEAAFTGSEFYIVTPNGEQISPDTRSDLKTRVVIEHSLEDKGTYKFSTGMRYGRIFRMYELNGKPGRMEDPSEPLPEGAKETAHFQAVTRAETYVSKGAPTEAALKPSGKGLEITPITHPNDVYAGEPVELTVLFEGKPAVGLEIPVYDASGAFSAKEPVAKLKTDAKGKIEFTPEKTGNYLARARHRVKAPEGAKAPVYSYTYTLTFEAAR
ncbi:DUF4198 domain-containing protein [Kordiimonas laminariae]|uniref:DUF4198 domain-containing protein n=1 Tax=Kordiimonas laminariae TaxID=2917717 RepID=UPI001FF3B4CD|nr:DUF4198 domain-containing protein [Kordiimonas laminariae]MCK0069435.1 DUF4198 domain-containing protein [Kordiimonas laminariae]